MGRASLTVELRFRPNRLNVQQRILELCMHNTRSRIAHRRAAYGSVSGVRRAHGLGVGP